MDDLPVAVIDNTISGSVTTSTVNYVTADQLGTPRAVTNGAGTTIWAWAYQGNPFGEQQPISTTGYVLNLRFPGQYYDAETGTNYNMFRTYEPATGRYLQSDPIGFSGGINIYTYGSGSPLNAFDSLGLACNARGCWDTPQEVAYANAGNYRDYYATACGNGDPYACRAGEVAADADVPGIRGPLTHITNFKLRASLHKNLPAMPCDLANQIVDQKMDDIRRGLAQARVAQLAGASEEDPLMVTKSAISDFHHQVFAQNGADPDVFGGDLWDSMHGETISGLLGDRYDWCSSPSCRP